MNKATSNKYCNKASNAPCLNANTLGKQASGSLLFLMRASVVSAGRFSGLDSRQYARLTTDTIMISHDSLLIFNRNSQVSLGCSSLYLLAAWSCLVAATVLCEFVKVTGTEIATGASATISRGIWKGTSEVAFPECGGYENVYIDPKVSVCDAATYPFLSCLKLAPHSFGNPSYDSGKRPRPFQSLHASLVALLSCLLSALVERSSS